MASNDWHQRGRGPYKNLTDTERAAIGEFATQHGSTKAAREYMISESTVRAIKRKYSEALLHTASDNEEEDCYTRFPYFFVSVKATDTARYFNHSTVVITTGILTAVITSSTLM